MPTPHHSVFLQAGCQECGLGLELSVSRQSRELSTSRLGLGQSAQRLGLGPIRLGLGPKLLGVSSQSRAISCHWSRRFVRHTMQKLLT